MTNWFLCLCKLIFPHFCFFAIDWLIASPEQTQWWDTNPKPVVAEIDRILQIKIDILQPQSLCNFENFVALFGKDNKL